MKYPPDIEAELNRQLTRELNSEMEFFHKENPNASSFAAQYHEYSSKYLISWYLELPKWMSNNEIREYLGIPVIEEIRSDSRHGWTIAEMIQLPA